MYSNNTNTKFCYFRVTIHPLLDRHVLFWGPVIDSLKWFHEPISVYFFFWHLLHITSWRNWQTALWAVLCRPIQLIIHQQNRECKFTDELRKKCPAFFLGRDTRETWVRCMHSWRSLTKLEKISKLNWTQQNIRKLYEFFFILSHFWIYYLILGLNKEIILLHCWII